MTSYAGKENQCRNFAPNIFNKNKCQNCFKPRETHLLSDKDLIKATPIYCGWLLLAPIGTDFDNLMHRARKWQRRYFILFEHGALRYALDDNANTLPQGTINMNQCSDVVHAEKITGQKYSLCIYHPDMKYFIRSENREETAGWLEQLIVFPETAKQDALNKKRLARRFGSQKAPSQKAPPTAVPAEDASKKRASIAYEDLRSPRIESPRIESTQEKVSSPEPVVETEFFNERVTSPTTEKGPDAEIKRGRSISRKSTVKKLGTQTADPPLRRAKSLDRDTHDTSDITIESLNQRKGWLLKRDDTTKKNWTKYWFVLAENKIKFYQDPSAEEFSHPDGEVNLAHLVKVTEIEINRNYGFSIHTTDAELVLAAVTMGIRRNWMGAIEKSAESVNEKEKMQDAEKENQPVVFDEKMVETTMLRRARMRERRKMGRSRTYDFAELRAAVTATIDILPLEKEKKSAELELHSPIERITLPIKIEKQDDKKVEENGIRSPELHKREIVTSPTTTSPRTPKSKGTKVSRKLPLTPEMLDQVDGRWEKIEKFDIFSQVLAQSKSEKPSPRITDSTTVAICNSLKSEVDLMEKQIQTSQREFGEFLNEHSNKVENDTASNHEDSLKGTRNSSKTKISQVTDDSLSYNSADSDKIRTLEIAHKCAVEENIRLRDEIVQGRLAREQEAIGMQAKIKDLKRELTMFNKHSQIKSGLESEHSGTSFKDKVSELETEMVENPRRKESDDSDEAGPSSSINQLVKQSKGEVEKSDSLKKALDLDSSHQRLAETIKSLQETRSSSEYGTTAVQEAFNANKATVLILQKKLLEDQQNWSSVKKCLQELRGKVLEKKHDKHADPQHLLPFLESVLDDTLQMIEKGGASDGVDAEHTEVAVESSRSKIAKARDPKEVERATLDKLKTLSEQLKTTDGESHFGSKHSLITSSSSTLGSLSLVGDQSISDQIPFHQKEKIFAEQLSQEAMIIAEMASTLENYASADVAQLLLHSDTQDIFPENGKPENQSNLLQHAGIVAEKLLLESRLTSELSKLRSTSNLQQVRHEFKSSSLPPSGSLSKTGQESWARGMVGDAGSLSLVQAQVNYILHVYNDRIARLSQDVKEAQHRADMFQQKLLELVHACKTRDIELVSQLAVEVDTKASLAQTVEDLPEWRRQVDYGMLHGAQASISSIDLRVEASLFAKLSQDIACMSSDSSSLIRIGTRILELDMSLSRALKAPVIGEHASIIAYEAISQAQLLFLTRRISKDYEEEIIKMKSAVRKQSAYCETLQQKLRDIENGDAAKMQELTNEHKQKVERLVQQLTLVEKARQEMTTEMDQKLNKLSLKQQREMERSEARHKQETDDLKRELDQSKARCEESAKDHAKEINQLKHELRDLKKRHQEQLDDAESRYAKELEKEKGESRKKLDSISSGDAKKMDEMQAEFHEKLERIVASHDEEIKELEEKRTLKLNRLKEKHEREIENERADKERALKDKEQKLEERFKEKQSLLDLKQQEKSKETKMQHDMQMSELQNFFERSYSDFEQTHKKQLDELANQYQQDVKRLEEEKAREMDEDVTSTKKAIMSMKKHYQDELAKLKTVGDETPEWNPKLQNQVDDLKQEMEVLSGLYSVKCVDISKREKEIKSLEERLEVTEENNQALKEQNEKLSQKMEEEMETSPLVTKDEKNDDIHRLRVELGAKKLQVSILEQRMVSLKQHVAVTLQGRGFLQGGDGDMFKGYDIMKSKSHPDFISLEETSMKGVTKRSSERR